ncbi:MAG: response regulator [Paracoccaceae bacterium]|nr:response regulator [Paracoccaceae bacterium]
MDKPLVLVAEYNATNAAIIRAMLADQPIRVEIYPDGGSAVEAFERTSPAVVLMDIQLPDMTGYEATQRIWAFKEMQRRATTPIIAATASSRPEDQQACFDAGLDDFISKPLNKQQLCAKLTYWISQSDELSDDTKHRIAG